MSPSGRGVVMEVRELQHLWLPAQGKGRQNPTRTEELLAAGKC